MRNILKITSYLLACIIFVYIAVYHWNHDSLTNIQLFKILYKQYLIAIGLFLIGNLLKK
jgi:uncharacterized membrane protein YphA (DoxX/SURF4 family)